MSIAAVDIIGLAARGAPILCLDTCSVLDIMRDPTRETIRDHDQQAAVDLVAAMETGIGLVGLIADQVRFEFQNHVDAIEEEATAALKKLRLQLARMDAVTAVFGPGGHTDLRHFDDHVTRSRSVVDRLIAAAISAPQGSEIATRALLRVNLLHTPAQKGKDSMKDCVVIETYLDVISALRAAGLTSKVVFLSSNKRDYTGETGRSLKPDLAVEFTKVGMEYALNFAAAKHFLGL